jgi:hypothetical protein
VKDAFCLANEVEEAWTNVPAPHVGELSLITWNWNQEEVDTFIDVAPMKVDIDSVGFYASTPLDKMPSEFASAYLGTFLRSLMLSLGEQKAVKFFDDALTRAHLVTCLKEKRFWDEVIKTHLSGKRLEVLLGAIECMVQERENLGLDDEDVETLQVRVAGL